MSVRAGRRAAELRSMAARMLRVANEIEADEAVLTVPVDRSRPAQEGVWSALGTQLVLAKAVETYRSRRKRDRFFDASLFGEPAWDILLDLFAARLQNRRISVSSACIASAVPQTTALRWLGLLEEAGLVKRHGNEADMRVTWVEMTDDACKQMHEFFENVLEGSSRVEHDIAEYLILDKVDKI